MGRIFLKPRQRWPNNGISTPTEVVPGFCTVRNHGLHCMERSKKRKVMSAPPTADAAHIGCPPSADDRPSKQQGVVQKLPLSRPRHLHPGPSILFTRRCVCSSCGGDFLWLLWSIYCDFLQPWPFWWFQRKTKMTTKLMVVEKGWCFERWFVFVGMVDHL